MLTTGALGRAWDSFLTFFRQDIGGDLGRDLKLAREIARRIGEDEPDDGAYSLEHVVLYLDGFPTLQVCRAFQSAGMEAVNTGPDEWHIPVPLHSLRRQRLVQVLAMAELLQMRGWRVNVVSG